MLEGVDLQAVLSDVAKRNVPSISNDKIDSILTELIEYFARTAVSSVTTDDMLDIDIELSKSQKSMVITTPLSRDYFRITLQYNLGTLNSLIDIEPLTSSAFITDDQCNWEQKRAADFPDFSPSLLVTRYYGSTIGCRYLAIPNPARPSWRRPPGKPPRAASLRAFCN